MDLIVILLSGAYWLKKQALNYAPPHACVRPAKELELEFLEEALIA